MKGKKSIAILLGSDKFPLLGARFDKVAFKNSADAFRSYLQSPDYGLGLLDKNILDLFGCTDAVERQDKALTDFILYNSASSDVIIIYYVGHGGFLSDRQYFLALHGTEPKRRHYTALKIKDLAETLKENASGKIVYLILDCCFAGSAVEEFQSDGLSQYIQDQTLHNFPESGTALLVASSKYEPALTPDGNNYTMLSEAMINILRFGISSSSDEFISLRKLGMEASISIKKKYGGYAVMPEIHSPRQINNDISNLNIFPNNYIKDHLNHLLSASKKLYSSDSETDPFNDWTTFTPTVPGSQGTGPSITDRRQYTIHSVGKEPSGANKYINCTRGIIRFQYKILEMTDNIIFFALPMKFRISHSYRTPPSQRDDEKLNLKARNLHIISPGHRGNFLEVGTTSLRDPANGYSPLRRRLIPTTDKHTEWVQGELMFDFSDLEDAVFATFAPRINEGVAIPGPGRVLITKVEIYGL
ncbi:caspase family protein [uncultured Methylobacterium sp.]|jgi:hypothetical protein|uniref:caspase family protein n=1 Tax=uncultured Methylobacterium sp. TaxID=157278 RepID=UPI002635F2FA|nr:caspase family protein [uncultured Methylobacterium sp.]